MPKHDATTSDFAVMDIPRLGGLLARELDSLEGGDGHWQGLLGEVSLLVFCDPIADRMRIVAPVAPLADVTGEQVFAMLHANFASSRDVRYALHEARVWAVYHHPLMALTAVQLSAALGQVRELVISFGTRYSAGDPQPT